MAGAQWMVSLVISGYAALYLGNFLTQFLFEPEASGSIFYGANLLISVYYAAPVYLVLAVFIFIIRKRKWDTGFPRLLAQHTALGFVLIMLCYLWVHLSNDM
jgi:amino acid transporter